MKRGRFAEEQIAYASKQVELGTKVNEVCRKRGVSDATFYEWRQKYGGLGPRKSWAHQRLIAQHWPGARQVPRR